VVFGNIRVVVVVVREGGRWCRVKRRSEETEGSDKQRSEGRQIDRFRQITCGDRHQPHMSSIRNYTKHTNKKQHN
jgi:hypothetical protein